MGQWRQHEWHDRRAAVYGRILGLKLCGRQSSGVRLPDAENELFIFELKCRQKLPGVIERGFKQLEEWRRHSGDKRIPVVILHGLGRRVGDDIVCLRLRDFAGVFGVAAGEASVFLGRGLEEPGGPGAEALGVEVRAELDLPEEENNGD